MSKDQANIRRVSGNRVYILVGLGLAFCFGIFLFHWLPDSASTWIPTTGPQENNRARHPDGYSIIIPPDWEARIHAKTQFSGSHLNAHPKLRPGRLPERYTPSMLVEHFTRKPVWPFGEAEQSTFQDDPCWRIAKRSEFEHGYMSLDLVFVRQSDWFRLTVAVPEGYGDGERGQEFPNIFEEYLLSFRYEPKGDASSDDDK